ncbi:MAG: phosphoglycerate mutase (2,3-diphosphoglycerate-independent) [Candidatus Yanofskybacteria bacterium RIFCSPLOWO2_01_FULL_41_34]|uniref:2,3-bisphosphoglycerate-independent phosphoglycerate mutase n=1 Tax=Candidatus Yanofskybacteria bacterium RIFCSPHIGHO2_01_FULL_41_26 TaxID=1802661 RepID=A0A1F8EBV6_9BACT|nr:MAG: phosphoglycerate mutase (2,3-diphosphoglycerate-independent) [Candidatus Yanofskybacteria bacterium RIFCSPHIGHO2_01_FULL_41_26]OGN21893.1 MAG: phosphoglycerate mutase (2,3-diphosphoglycerate-independent) [Candidatus Yanofskybacteria bacterium RIFCSPLOWO2_01_FULL_41_34]
MRPVVLTILDGWGYSKQTHGNAVLNAKTPNIDFIQQNFPSLLLQASGKAAGMTWGEPGNSEVGHLTIGAGRIIFQYLSRINKTIDDDSFFSNEILNKAISHTHENNSILHLVGLLTSGSVHAYLAHLFALIDLAKRNNVTNLKIHLFTDGKDSGLKEAPILVKKVEDYLSQTGIGHISTIMGRDFAMDRSKNWDLTQMAYQLLTTGIGEKTTDIYKKLDEYYSLDYNDSKIPPTVVNATGIIQENDALIFFNFREDSMRQLVESFINQGFDIFQTKKLNNLYVASLTQYFENPNLHVAFPVSELKNGLAEMLSKNNKKQFHIAETEKYAHVTYFFNCLKSLPFDGETDFIVESAKNSLENPEMKAGDMVERVLSELDRYDFCVINFANADTLSHFGNLEVAVQGIQAIDKAVGRIQSAILEKGGLMLVTADHGNAESLTYQSSGEKETKHNNNPVPFYLIGKEFERRRSDDEIESAMKQPTGLLADIAPTILELMGIEKPTEMTGESLLDILH